MHLLLEQPSATIHTIYFLPSFSSFLSLFSIASKSYSSSGIIQTSAPQVIAETKAKYPQFRPIVSITQALLKEAEVSLIASVACLIIFKAVSTPKQ